jgi:hypothetical protein
MREVCAKLQSVHQKIDQHAFNSPGSSRRFRHETGAGAGSYGDSDPVLQAGRFSPGRMSRWNHSMIRNQEAVPVPEFDKFPRPICPDRSFCIVRCKTAVTDFPDFPLACCTSGISWFK